MTTGENSVHRDAAATIVLVHGGFLGAWVETEREAEEQARAAHREKLEAEVHQRSFASELKRETYERERPERLAGWLSALAEAGGRQRKALVAELEELTSRGGLARGTLPPVR